MTTTTEPKPRLVGGEPITMTIGEPVCTLTDDRELHIVHTPMGYEVVITQPNGAFPIQTLMDGDTARRFPDKSSVIAQVWQLVIEKGEGIKGVSTDPSLLPNDPVRLKQIIFWLQQREG